MYEENLLPCPNPYCIEEHKPIMQSTGVDCMTQFNHNIHCPCGFSVSSRSMKDVIDVWNSIPRNLKWTQEPPIVPGWYFMHVRLPGKTVRVVHIRRVPMTPKRATSGMLCVSQTPQDEPPGTPLCELDPNNRSWAGPIPEPVEPKDAP